MPATPIQGGSVGVFINGSGTIVSGTDAFTDVNGNFYDAMVGSNITVQGAGAGGADYVGTITDFVSQHAVTVAPNADTSVTTAFYAVGTGGVISSNWTTTVSITLATAQSAGDVIAAGITCFPGDSAAAITDLVNTYTQRGSTVTNADYSLLLFTTKCVADGGGSNKITAHFTSGQLVEFGYRHFSGTGAYSQVATGNSTGTACTTSNFGSTVLAGSTIWGWTGLDSHFTAPGTGYIASPFNPVGDAEEYQIVAASGTFAVTCTQDSNAIYIIGGVTFAPPSTLNAILFGSD
jgi:hypothetical protein